MANVCPKCQKDDRISRLSAIVESGRASGRVSGTIGSGLTNLYGKAATDLANALAAPREPDKPKGLGLWWIVLVYPVIPVIALAPGLLCAAPFTLVPSLLPGDVNFPHGETWAILAGIPATLAGGWWAVRYFSRLDAKRRLASSERHASEKPRWEAAVQKWIRLYFCDRDSIVFDPETSEHCEVGELKQFLYT